MVGLLKRCNALCVNVWANHKKRIYGRILRQTDQNANDWSKQFIKFCDKKYSQGIVNLYYNVLKHCS